MSSNIDLTKFIGSSKNLLDDLYDEERENPQTLGDLNDYLALPKTEAYIKRENEKKEQEEEEKQAYEDRIEEKYKDIINKISTD
jgi:hypothetical protein